MGIEAVTPISNAFAAPLVSLVGLRSFPVKVSPSSVNGGRKCD
jgi:hypothetical protein